MTDRASDSPPGAGPSGSTVIADTRPPGDTSTLSGRLPSSFHIQLQWQEEERGRGCRARDRQREVGECVRVCGWVGGGVGEGVVRDSIELLNAFQKRH